MRTKLRVVVADDHEQCRWAMVRLLRVEFEVVAAVADGSKLVDAAMSLLPDVIVSDVHMPLLAGMQAMDDLRRKGCDIPFVLVSAGNSEVEEYIKRGAMAFVNKTDLGQDLVTAVFSAAFGISCVSRNAVGNRSNTLRCA